jgi:hypothetical protein
MAVWVDGSSVLRIQATATMHWGFSRKKREERDKEKQHMGGGHAGQYVSHGGPGGSKDGIPRVIHNIFQKNKHV